MATTTSTMGPAGTSNTTTAARNETIRRDSTNKNLYWVIGALIVLAIIIAFARSYRTTETTIINPAAPSETVTAPANMEANPPMDDATAPATGVNGAAPSDTDINVPAAPANTAPAPTESNQ